MSAVKVSELLYQKLPHHRLAISCYAQPSSFYLDSFVFYFFSFLFSLEDALVIQRALYLDFDWYDFHLLLPNYIALLSPDSSEYLALSEYLNSSNKRSKKKVHTSADIHFLPSLKSRPFRVSKVNTRPYTSTENDTRHRVIIFFSLFHGLNLRNLTTFFYLWTNWYRMRSLVHGL